MANFNTVLRTLYISSYHRYQTYQLFGHTICQGELGGMRGIKKNWAVYSLFRSYLHKIRGKEIKHNDFEDIDIHLVLFADDGFNLYIHAIQSALELFILYQNRVLFYPDELYNIYKVVNNDVLADDDENFRYILVK